MEWTDLAVMQVEVCGCPASHVHGPGYVKCSYCGAVDSLIYKEWVCPNKEYSHVSCERYYEMVGM